MSQITKNKKEVGKPLPAYPNERRFRHKPCVSKLPILLDKNAHIGNMEIIEPN